MNDTRREKSLALNKLKDDIRKILHKEEPDPWNQPEKPKVTEEEIEQAIEDMNKPKPRYPWWKLGAALVGLWGLGHFVLLYVMIGSPISGAILIYVLVNLYIFLRYGLLLGKVNRK